MPLIGANGGLLGSQRSTNTLTGPGLWTPNEQVLLRRANTWPRTDDQYATNVSLLLHMDGSNGSTTFTDNSSNALTVTVNGNAQISTTQSKFGGASGYLDGTGDYLTLASTSLFGFGTGDFTIEYWTYPTRNTINETFIDTRPSDTGTPLVLGKSSGGAVRCYDGSTVRTGGTMTLNQWHHVAWSRSGSSNNVFLNGTSVISFTNAFDAGSSRGLVVGSNVVTTAENCQGYFDDLRITKGIARYTSNFTPPTTAFPNA